MIVLVTFGATNSNLMANIRVVFAMGESKTFFSQVAKVHPKYKTPGNAALVMGIWSCVLVLSGSFDVLADMFVFVSWIFYGLVILGLFFLRKKFPDKERPYKVWGYPIVPIIFLLFTTIYIVTTLYNDINNYIEGRSIFINSVFGLILTAIGIPLYFYFKKKNEKRS